MEYFNCGLRHRNPLTVYLYFCCALFFFWNLDFPKVKGDDILFEDFRIASFNIQIFGITKYSRTEVVKVLVEICSAYDLLFIQELRNIPDNSCGNLTGPVICDFVEDLQYFHPSKNIDFKISSRVGGYNKEQYVAIYDSNRIEINDWFTFGHEISNGNASLFERPPFITMINFVGSDVDIFVSSIHTKPDNAFAEILGLTEVVNELIRVDEDIILLGDFNADGDYFDIENGWDFFFDVLPDYNNLIEDGVDTTVSPNNDHTYDRIVVSPSVSPYVVNRSPKAYPFDSLLDLNGIKTQGCEDDYIKEEYCPNPSNYRAAVKVSDHYPVEIKLRIPMTSNASNVIKIPLHLIFSLMSLIILIQLL